MGSSRELNRDSDTPPTLFQNVLACAVRFSATSDQPFKQNNLGEYMSEQIAQLILQILLGLMLKHFIIDFPLQTPYQWMNKGTYGHPGGVLHSTLHGVGTAFVLFQFNVSSTLIMMLSFSDSLIHYHIDYAKVKLNKFCGWGPTTHSEFWVVLGFDQLLHMITYIGIVYLTV